MRETERSTLLELLKSVDCAEYLPLFNTQEITPDLLASMDKDAIQELGVWKVGDRLRIQLLVKLLRIENIKGELNVRTLRKSIQVSSSSIQNTMKAINIDSMKPKPVHISLILPDGKTLGLDVSTIDGIKKICELVNIPNGRLSFIDYSNSGRVHEIKTDHELAEILNADTDRSNIKHRLIVSKNADLTVDSINTSNKIHMRGNTTFSKGQSIKPFMGGRPPSELISTNLRDYFPDLNHEEIEDIRRRSIRMSINGQKLIEKLGNTPVGNRFTLSSTNVRNSVYSRLSNISLASNRLSMASMMSGISDVSSYGIGQAVKIEQVNSRKLEEAHAPTEDQNDTMIELMDESEDEEYFDIDNDLLEKEVTDGPSVWHRGPKIGQGSFGDVYLGLNGLTGELMAVKQVDVNIGGNKTPSEGNETKITALKREISFLRDMAHERVVRYLGCAQDVNRMYIFLEYVPGGSVASLLGLYGAFAPPLVRSFTNQVLIGVQYLHSKGVVHRDIKGGNILVDNTGGVKIGDFGISQRINEEADAKNKKSESLQGSVYWMAPEVVKQQSKDTGPAADVWAIGALVVEMFTGTHPFPTLAPMQALFQLGTGKVCPDTPDAANENARAFLKRTFALQCHERATIEELLEMKWFKESM